MAIDSGQTVTGVAEPRFNEVKTFSVLGTQLLSKGKTAQLLALAPQLWVHCKVYGDGGERVLHCHPNEDHIFFFVAGHATFRDADANSHEVGPFDGVMIPRGVLYAFENTGDEPLVFLRVGAGAASGGVRASKASKGALEVMRTRGVDGNKLTHDDRVEGVPIPGRVFTGS